MVRSNDKVVLEFLNTIVKVTSPGASNKYVLMVMNKFCESNKEFFPFVQHLHINLKGIKADSKLNSVEPKSIGKFLRVLINTLFSDLFMLMIKRKINSKLAKDLKYLGVKLDEN